MDGVNRHAERAGLFPVHIDAIFGNIRHAIGADFHDSRILGDQPEKLVLGVHQGLMPQRAPVQKLKVKTDRRSQLNNGGRLEGEDHGVADGGKGAHGSFDDCRGFQIGTVAQMPVLETDENHAVILRASGETVPGNGHNHFHRFFFIFLKVFFNLFGDLICLFQRRTRWHDHLGQQGSLIFIRQIGGGHAQKQNRHDDHDNEKNDQIAFFPGEGMIDHADITITEFEKNPIEPHKKGFQEKDGVFRRLMTGFDRFEQGCAQDRRQDQRHDHRKKHGGNDRNGELAVDDAGRSREKGHGTEHGGQYQADADERARDLLHRFSRGFLRRQPLLAHNALHIFDDDDGVVDQKADGQHHGKHGQHVNRKTEEPQNGERSQNNHRHGDGGNQRGAHVSQEKPHHQKNKKNSDDQCFDDFIDGHFDKYSGIVRINNFHAGGEKAAHFSHFCLHGVGRIQRIGVRRLTDGDTRRRPAVVADLNVVYFGAQLCSSHIAHADNGAVRIGPKRDRGKFLRR